jgi:hypothetical protein
MSYLIFFGIVAAAGCVLTFMSREFAYAMSRMVEAGFEAAEYRLALRAREREVMRCEARMANVVSPFRGGEAALPVNKRSTQQLGIARVAA